MVPRCFCSIHRRWRRGEGVSVAGSWPPFSRQRLDCSHGTQQREPPSGPRDALNGGARPHGGLTIPHAITNRRHLWGGSGVADRTLQRDAPKGCTRQEFRDCRQFQIDDPPSCIPMLTQKGHLSHAGRVVKWVNNGDACHVTTRFFITSVLCTCR
jgi:hypothetical protein